MASLSIEGATRRFGPTTAVDAVDLAVAPGEFVALLGPSGCGKTTLLRLLAGFEPLDEGRISVGGELLSGPGHHVPTEARRIGMVFQSYALWPHMTVWDNVAFALKVRRLPRADLVRRAQGALEAVGLSALSSRRPSALSGGQRQRVALARCLAMDPRLVLLDEPLANLDAHLRQTMQQEFRAFHARTRATMIYVTHDQAEALALADTVAVMMTGRLRQVAPPRVLYAEPADADVARFIGRGAVVPVTVRAVDAAAGADGAWRCDADLRGVALRLRCRPGQPPGPAEACLRPEAVTVTEAGARGSVTADVRSATFAGARLDVEAGLPGPDAPVVHATAEGAADLVPGHPIGLIIKDGWVMP